MASSLEMVQESVINNTYDREITEDYERLLTYKRELRDAQDVGKSSLKGKKYSNHAMIKLLNPETVKLTD